MYIDPRHLNPAIEPTPAMLHREEYLNEQKLASKKSEKLPTVPTTDTRLLRALNTSRVGRFFRFA